MQANLIWLITVGQRRQVLHRVSTEKPLIRPVPEVNGKLSSLAVKLSIWVPILQGLFIPAPACFVIGHPGGSPQLFVASLGAICDKRVPRLIDSASVSSLIEQFHGAAHKLVEYLRIWDRASYA